MTKYSQAILSLLIALSTCIVSGQQSGINSVINDLNEPVIYGEVLSHHFQAAGSQFFIDGWSEGNIYHENGGVSRNKMLQYNGYKDQLYWLNPSTADIVIVDKLLVSKFTLRMPLTHDTVTFKRIEPGTKNDYGPDGIFAQVLAEGEYSLYAMRKIENTGERNIVQNERRVTLPVLEPRPVYIIRCPGNLYHRLQRIRRQNFINLMPEIGNELRVALQERRNRVRSEEDLIEAVLIANQLKKDTI